MPTATRASPAPVFKDVDGLVVEVDVTNSGSLAGKEIVQVYVHDRQASLPRPEKELKGFAKVALQPGETKTVRIALDFRAFAFYHPRYGQWIAEDGEYDLLIGASSADIRCVLAATLQSSAELPCVLDMESTVREWLADRRGRALIEPLMQQITGVFATTEESNIGMDMAGFVYEMPPVALLNFNSTALPASPEAMIDDLLAKAHARTGL